MSCEISYVKKVSFVEVPSANPNFPSVLELAESYEKGTIFSFQRITRAGFPQDPYTLIPDAKANPFQNTVNFVNNSTRVRHLDPIVFCWDGKRGAVSLRNLGWLEEVMYHNLNCSYPGFYVVEVFTMNNRSLGYYGVPIGSPFEKDITPLFEKKAPEKLTPFSLWQTPSETVIYLDKELAFKAYLYGVNVNSSIDKKAFKTWSPNPFAGWRYAARRKVRDLTPKEVEEIYKGWVLCAINLSDPSGYLSGLGYPGSSGRAWTNFSFNILKQTYGYVAEKLFIPVLEKGDKQLANGVHVLYDKKVTEELVSIGNTLIKNRNIGANHNKAVENADKRITPDMVRTETLEYLKTWLSDHFRIKATFTL